MKNTNTCPKCQSTDVVRVDAFKNTSSSNLIHLSRWGTQYAYFDRYICTSCGFIEQYIDLEHKGWQNWLNKKLEEDSLDSDFV
jgi:predicted nucleic-acid-binding Zn-ribbon protein